MRIAMVVALAVVGCTSDPGVSDMDAGPDARVVEPGSIAELVGDYTLAWTCLSEPCDYDLPAGVVPMAQASITARIEVFCNPQVDPCPEANLSAVISLRQQAGASVHDIERIVAGGYRVLGMRNWDDFIIYPTDFGFELEQVYDDADGTPEHLYLAATRI